MWFWYSAVEAHPGGRVAQIKTPCGPNREINKLSQFKSPNSPPFCFFFQYTSRHRALNSAARKLGPRSLGEASRPHVPLPLRGNALPLLHPPLWSLPRSVGGQCCGHICDPRPPSCPANSLPRAEGTLKSRLGLQRMPLLPQSLRCARCTTRSS